MWKDSNRNIVVIFKTNILRIVGFFVRRSAVKVCLKWPSTSQSGVELEKNFECDFMASKDAYGSYKPYGKVRLKFGPF